VLSKFLRFSLTLTLSHRERERNAAGKFRCPGRRNSLACSPLPMGEPLPLRFRGASHRPVEAPQSGEAPCNGVRAFGLLRSDKLYLVSEQRKPSTNRFTNARIRPARGQKKALWLGTDIREFVMGIRGRSSMVIHDLKTKAVTPKICKFSFWVSTYPHPNPLPKGEGTGRFRQNSSPKTSRIATLAPLSHRDCEARRRRGAGGEGG
jgi:hypothetical protein